MDGSAEVSTLSFIDVLLNSCGEKPAGGVVAPGSVQHAAAAALRDEDGRDPMPDSTTTPLEKPPAYNLHCGDDVLVPNKDGRYYLGTIVEVSTSNRDNVYEGGAGEPGCLVKFGDGTHSWAPAAALKLLSAPPADDARIMCVVCKQREGAAAGPGQPVTACDMCGRGYHGKCHTPPVDTWINGASWNCRRCVDQRYRVAAAENKALKRTELVRLKNGVHRRAQHPIFNHQRCDTASTTSSTASDHGKEESHCYCGKKSDWLAQMLMCCRCSRWFHQRCVVSLRYPLYAGDKMYIFACWHCNGGTEYLRRLELRWLDLAHLALYNLAAYNARNYFDLDAVVVPYVMDNWHALQLPQKMWNTSAAERRERILSVLAENRGRFKCGREMKKKANIWGMRVRRPPPHPLHLSALSKVKEGEPLTDELVRQLAPRLRFLPARPDSPPLLADSPTPHDSSQPTSSNNGKSSYSTPNQNMIVPVDEHWLNLMMGKRFHHHFHSNSENDSPCSSPSPTEFMNNTLINNHAIYFGLRYDLLDINSSRANSPYTFDDETDENVQKAKYCQQRQLKLYKMDYQNGGFVKKSVPFSKQPPGRKKLSGEKKRKVSKVEKCGKRLRNFKDKRDTMPLSPMCRSTPPDKERSPSADPEIFLKGDCSTSSYESIKPNESLVPSVPAEATLSSRLPEHTTDPTRPTDVAPTQRETPQRRLSTLSDNLAQCSIQIDQLSGASDSTINNFITHTSKIATMNLEISKLSTKNIIEHSKIMSLQRMNSMEPWPGGLHEHESSGDETSSRGTLDAIIPPLKNFQGKNNPFLMLNTSTARGSAFSIANKLFSKNSLKNSVQKNARSRISLPVQLNPVIAPTRTLKRQLSEKDLIIGPNGEVKRRKHRRPRKNVQLNQSCPLPDRTNGIQQKVPSNEMPSKKRADSNGRRLRQRQEKNYYENNRRSSGGNTAAAAVQHLQLSPHKNESPKEDHIQLSDLKSSVQSYFGAVTRMRAGEGFTFAARRAMPDGKIQYLIEWDTSAS